MTRQFRRDIVVELERTQIVRRRAATDSRFCERCRRETDFVDLDTAAGMFDMPADELFGRVRHSGVHLARGGDGRTAICISSFLDALNARSDQRIFTKIVGGEE